MAATKALRKSYIVDQKHAEIYTGGQIALVAGDVGLVLPQQSQLNTINLSNPNIHTEALVEDESRVVAVAAHGTKGKIAVAYSSEMIRIYEPALKEEQTGGISASAAVVVDKQATAMNFEWREVSKWKCQLVQWLAWDNFAGNTNAFVAAASADSTLKVFDQRGQFCTHNFRGHNGPVTYCRFDSESSLPAAPHQLVIYSAGQDCTIRVWSLQKSSLLATLSSHMSPVTDMDLYDHSSGRRLVSVGRDRMINVWDIKSFTLCHQIPAFESLESMIMLPSGLKFPRTDDSTVKSPGAHVIVGGESGLLKIWNVDTKTLVYEEPTKSADFGIEYLLLDKLNGMLFEVTDQQNIVVRDIATFKITKTLVGFNDEIIDVKWASNDSIAVATNSAQVRVFTIPDYGCRFLGQADPNAQHKDTVLSISVSHDRKYIASGSKDQKIIVWDAVSGRALAQLAGHASDVTSVAFFHKTSRYLASTSNDMTWKLWDLQEIKADGFANISSSTITVKAHGKDINSVALSPNDQILITASQDKTSKLFRFNAKFTSAQEWATLTGHKRGVWDVAFSPVEQCVATSSGDRTIKLWSLSDFTCLKTFEGHTGTVLRISFVTAGTQLLSAGADGLIKLWNIHSNECINTFDQHQDKIWGLAVKRDGEEFISGGADSVIQHWTDNTKLEEEKELVAKEQNVIAEQNLANSLRSKDYHKALRISLKLDKPMKTLHIFEQIVKDSITEAQVQRKSTEDEAGMEFAEPTAKADALLGELLNKLSIENLEKLLIYIRDWNTNAKHSLIAQRVLNHILRTYSPDALLKLPRIREILQALIPYTARHFQRVDRLIQRSFLVDYTLTSMQILDDMADMQLGDKETSNDE